jgi:hypothetical protein
MIQNDHINVFLVAGSIRMLDDPIHEKACCLRA